MKKIIYHFKTTKDMREIKFRGKTEQGKWVYGFYMESSKEHHLGKRSLIVTGDRSTTYAGKEFIEVIPETVGQYTGLKDKNGKEIYEGGCLKQTILIKIDLILT